MLSNTGPGYKVEVMVLKCIDVDSHSYLREHKGNPRVESLQGSKSF